MKEKIKCINCKKLIESIDLNDNDTNAVKCKQCGLQKKQTAVFTSPFAIPTPRFHLIHLKKASYSINFV